MADKDTSRDIRTLFAQFRTSDHWAVSLARDLIWVAGVVGGIALSLFLICGTWPAVVTIESGSMIPNMNIGDLVVVVQQDRYGEFLTWEEGKQANVTKFNNYGDVIIYKPNGLDSVHPIIHRTMVYATNTTPLSEIRGSQLRTNYTAAHDGYITWGDHNPAPDQFVTYPGIGTPEPVKEEWIVGKALFTVPLVGYLPLHIWEVIVVVIVIMVLHELYLRSRESKSDNGSERGKPKKKSGKKKNQG
ncbi:MAG: signal peptidase I [Methanoregula sp.]|nr:signal peptidase I [Methanoregula sp.]